MLFDYCAGLVVGLVLIAADWLITRGLQGDLPMGAILFIATWPLIPVELNDLAFTFGCLTPGSLISLGFLALEWGSRSKAVEAKRAFQRYLIAVLPILVGRLIYFIK